MKGYIFPFPKKGDLGITKNYKSIILTVIDANIYIALLLNRIRPEVDKIEEKWKCFFRSNRSSSSKEYVLKFLKQRYCS